MRVLILCNSTKSQGLGHVTRAAAVADAALNAGWGVEFCGQFENQVALDLLSGRSAVVHPPRQSIEAIGTLAAERSADVVHIDSYAAMGRLHLVLADRGILLSSVEDLENGRRSADLVVDPSPTSEKSYRPSDGSSRLLRGTKAIPLRRELLQLPRHVVAKRREGPLEVLIVMGGTDALNLTTTLTELWLRTGLESVCHVVSNKLDLSESLSVGEDQRVVIHQPGPALPELFPKMDLVISGAGTTIWELASLGVPMAVVQIVENQLSNYDFVVSTGMAVGLGEVRDGHLNEQLVLNQLRDLGRDNDRRNLLSESTRAQVDGAGSRRVVELWTEMLAARPGLYARTATIDDASRLFDWRNEALVRSVSKTSSELRWDEHLLWVEDVVSDTLRLLLIVEIDGVPAGTVRFDMLDESEWEVSITIDPVYRGKGLGNGILAAAERRFAHGRTDIVLTAEMRESNKGSYRLFRSGGYVGDLRPGTRERWYKLYKHLATSAPLES